jgi:methyl-accepting chemotaxis protein WspA
MTIGRKCLATSLIASILILAVSISGYQAVNDGMRNQSLGAEQISEAMGQVAGGAKQTEISLQEFNQATVQLRQSAELLNQEVAQFTV